MISYFKNTVFLAFVLQSCMVTAIKNPQILAIYQARFLISSISVLPPGSASEWRVPLRNSAKNSSEALDDSDDADTSIHPHSIPINHMRT